MSKQITISDLLQMFLHHIKLIIAVTLLGGLLAFLYVSFMVTPVYTTSALITLFTVDPDMKSIISGANISITTVEDSYFLRINSSSSDPQTAANIANLVANTAPEVFKKYFGDAGKVDTVDEASVPSRPSSPDVKRYVIIGLLIGLVVSLVISFLIEIVDTTIKPGDDLYKQYEIPVFAEILDFDSEGGVKKK